MQTLVLTFQVVATLLPLGDELHGQLLGLSGLIFSATKEQLQSRVERLGNLIARKEKKISKG